jgi:hypothetical protein
MKKYLVKIILVIVISFGGCYTVLWSPEEPLPSENINQIFYSEPFYGGYNYYYDYPWWITGRQEYITPYQTQSSERSSTGSSVRNSNGFRENPDNNNPIIRNDSPTRSSRSNDNSGSVSKTNSDNNSGSSTEQTRSSGISRSNEGNNSARNNNGNRNSGNERR